MAPGIASWRVSIQRCESGEIYVEPQNELGLYPERLTDSLDHWAAVAPERTFIAQRDSCGQWKRVSYADFRDQARSLACALIERGVSAERPLAILSGNDIAHALLAFGAMYAGVPYAPISPSYSLLSSDFSKLRRVLELLTPGLVFANESNKFAGAFEVVPTDIPVIMDLPTSTRDTVISARPGPDTVAKVLFTSGSTGVPKGVITTHRMLCSNQEMLRAVFPFFRDEPPVICDWLPWHHTFGGSHNVGLVLYNGGTLYIDGGHPVGNPMTGQFAETIRNLEEIAPTVFFNVPKGYEMLVRHLRQNSKLRRTFFSRLRMMFYAGAGLSQAVWDELDALSIETCGARIPMLTGLGATETAPFALCATPSNTNARSVGLPVPGVHLKLSPVNDKLEARVKGPNVTPGFWREPDLTRAAYDAEGYYRMGDALQFADRSDDMAGFLFDGRIDEDFKLSTGTWVSVGPLRTKFILHCAPHVRDVVIAGHDSDDVAALIVPDGDARPELFQSLLATFAANNPGSSMRIERAILLTDPLSMDAGELTDKGTINQRAVLQRRNAVVAKLYSSPYDTDVIVAQTVVTA